MGEYRDIPEMIDGVEVERGPTSEVLVHFLRHEEKGASIPGEPDQAVELTLEGKQSALAQAQEVPAGIGIAAGTDRIRSAHTALLRLEGAEGKLTPGMSFAEAKAVADSEVKVGSKVTTLPELNFDMAGTPEMKATFYKAYAEGHGLEFLLHESDDLARQVKDLKSKTYSRIAAEYSSLVAREMRVGNAFHTVVAKDPEKYADVENRIERYFGTHQTVSESFYMKVLEKMHGRDQAEAFIEQFRDQDGKGNGFGYQEGFNVRITNGGEGQHVVIEGPRDYPPIEVTPQLLREIIEDAQVLDEDIQKQIEQASQA